MKKNINVFYFSLVILFMQLKVASSEFDAASCAGGSCSSVPKVATALRSSADDSSAPSNALTVSNNLQQHFDKLLAYSQAAKSFWQTEISSNQKGFLGLLGLALAIHKRDKIMAMLVSVKDYMWRRKLEYAVFTVLVEGWRRNFIVFRNPAASTSDLPTKVKDMPGETYILDLKLVNSSYLEDEDNFEEESFEQTKSTCIEKKMPFILAKISTTKGNSPVAYNYCDSKKLHKLLFGSGNYLFDLSYKYPIKLSIEGKALEEVHYFELDLSSGEFAHIGSNYDLQDNNPNQEAKLKHFVNAIIANDEEIYDVLKYFQNNISINPQYVQLKTLNRYIKILNLIIAQLEVKGMCNVRAKYLISTIYHEQDQDDKARALLESCKLEGVGDALLVEKINQLKMVLRPIADSVIL
ncbi:MAG: hypothetical protein P4L22_05915 [Candidatus Babeliales bacterium]|nr:hypothetical protein [Candidatus Babeliales bacterium]